MSGHPLEVGERVPIFYIFVNQIKLVERDLNCSEELVLLEPIRVPDGGLEQMKQDWLMFSSYPNSWMAAE